MDIELLEKKYTNAINLIMDKAAEFSNIKIFIEQVESLNNEYYEKLVDVDKVIRHFESNFDNYKNKHIELLKKKNLRNLIY